MKKVITFMMAVAMAFLAFVGGYMLTPEKIVTVTTIDKSRVEELEEENKILRREITCRVVLGTEATRAYNKACRQGYLDYELYVDGHRSCHVHSPVSDTRSEWDVVYGIVENIYELRDHYGSDVEITFEFDE